MMFTEIELYSEPLDILNHTTGKSEMTFFESSFLCGLIKKYRPCKILEVGVAAGAATGLILNCISKLRLDSSLFSIDISKEYYTDTKKKTGYAIDEMKPFLPEKLNHKLLTGNVVSAFLDEIGGGIDFLILDTAHALPGEVMDFLVCFPYLSRDAVVVLHDIVLNHLADISKEYTRCAFATKLLLDTVAAEKILCEDHSREAGYPNIGAFRCTPDTEKYISNVFSSLTISWFFPLSEKYLKSYRDSMARYYGKEQLLLFDKAVLLNTRQLQACQEYKSYNTELIRDFHKLWKDCQYVLFYGAGDLGHKFYNYAKTEGLKVDAFVISDYVELTTPLIDTVPVFHLKDIPYPQEKCVVVLTIGEMHHHDIEDHLKERGFMSIFPTHNKQEYQKLCGAVCSDLWRSDTKVRRIH